MVLGWEGSGRIAPHINTVLLNDHGPPDNVNLFFPQHVEPVRLVPSSMSEILMRKIVFIAAIALLSAGTVFAQAPASAPSGNAGAASAAGAGASNCEAQAVGKNGKPLTGAAKTSFMKKCEGGSTPTAAASCASKAVDKNGKPLAGAAKTSFMKKCEAAAGK
jgi:hypothetical protein